MRLAEPLPATADEAFVLFLHDREWFSVGRPARRRDTPGQIELIWIWQVDRSVVVDAYKLLCPYFTMEHPQRPPMHMIRGDSLHFTWFLTWPHG